MKIVFDVDNETSENLSKIARIISEEQDRRLGDKSLKCFGLPALDEYECALIDRGDKEGAVSSYRRRAGVSLQEAKRVVDSDW